MRKPKEFLVVLFLYVALSVTAAPLKQKRESEKELPHSQDYYDGYIKALVDHYQQIVKVGREARAAGEQDAPADSQAKSDDKLQDKAQETSVNPQGAQASAKESDGKSEDLNNQTNQMSDPVAANLDNQSTDSNSSTSNQTTYTNPEQTNKPVLSDTEESESATPDAHVKSEKSPQTDQQFSNLISKKEKQADFLFKATSEENLPETIKDIKYYTGSKKDFEDMKKRSSDDDLADPEDQLQVGGKSSRGRPAMSAKKSPDMESESKVTSHSSSTYTPGDPFKNPPQTNKDQDPDPNKEEPYKKDTEKAAPEKEPEASVSRKTRLPFLPVLLLPVNVDSDGQWQLPSAGVRRDNLGSRREKDKKEDKEKEKDKDKDDDDEDEDEEHAYIAPLHGYPGWYEGGHGIPYGYPQYGGFGFGGGIGGHGYGHHGSGHHGSGHYGNGHGYGHGNGHDMVLDNGVIWPSPGGFVNFMHSPTPCACNERSAMPFNFGNGFPMSLI